MKRLALAIVTAALARDATATGPSTAAERARELTVGLDLDAARSLLATADGNDPYVKIERARLALYDGDCDGAAAIFSDPALAKLDEEAGLGAIATGCARAIAATTVVEDPKANITIRFQDDADQALAPLIVDTVTKARDAITRDLGVDWPKPTRIVVVRDLHALSAMTGLPYESASTTGTVGVAKWGRVTLLSPRASQHGFPWRDTLAHELTHLAVTRASGDRAPLWLQEGLAKREEVRWRTPGPFDDRPSPESVVAYGIQKHLDVPLDKLGPSIAMLPSADQAMVAFAEVTSFVRVMVEQAGDAATQKLLADLRTGGTIEHAMTTSTGADLGGWETRWRAHLTSVAATPPASLLVAENKELRTMREHVRLAELLIGREHDKDAVTELDTLGAPLLSDPHVRYLKSRALEKDSSADALRVLGDPTEVSSSYAPWWAIRGRLSHDGADFVEAVAQDPFDVEAACEAAPGAPGKVGDALCKAARNAGVPDVGRE